MALSTPTIIALLLSYVVFCGLVMYFCVIADPGLSPTAYKLQVVLPDKLWKIASRTMNEKQMNAFQSLMDLGLVMVYFFVVLGCWTIVFWYIYPWIDESQVVSSYHKYVGIFVFLACFGSWRLANKSRPGMITAKSFKRYDHFPYDNLMFVPNKRCETTRLLRIPRSKFDRIKYNQNVPRYDHYCGWVANTIGEENYRWFLLFLVIHVIMCVYGSAVCSLLFVGEIQEKQLLQITFFDRATGKDVRSNWFIVSQYLFARKTLEFAVLAVMFVMGIALGAFLGYHIFITSYNRTTNEDGKWSDITRWYKKEQKRYQEAVKKGLIPAESNKLTENKPETIDGDVGCTGGSSGVQQSAEAPEFFDPGPAPQNVYDRGFIENWKEVIFPPSLRNNAFELGGYSRPERLPKTENQGKKSSTLSMSVPSDKTE